MPSNADISGKVLNTANSVGPFADTSAFADAEQVLFFLLTHAEDYLILADTEGKLQLYNQCTSALVKNYLGIDVYQGMPVSDIIFSDDKAALANILQSVWKGENISLESRLTFGNQVHYFHNDFRPVCNRDGSLTGAVVRMREVTERKETEQVLQESEQRWRFALEGSNQGLWDWNVKSGEVYYSDSYRTLYGFSAADQINSYEHWEERIHPDDRDRMKQDVTDHLNGGKQQYESVYRLRRKDGHYAWVLGRGMILGYDAAGNPTRMIGTHTDITAQKNAEEQYWQLFNNNPLPSLIYDPDTLRIMEVNEEAASHYGYTRNEFSQILLTQLHPADVVPHLMQIISENRNNQKFSIPKWRQQKKNGEEIWVTLHTSPITYNSSPARLVMVHDITDKVNAERELQKSNERFQLAAKAASEALWEWDIKENKVFISPVYKEMFGFDIDPDKGYNEWHEYIHPEDRSEVTTSFYRNIEDPKSDHWSKAYRYLRADGSYAHVIDNCMVLRNKEGKALKVIGAMQDISTKKVAEEEALKSNERFRLATKATSDAIYDWDILHNELHWGEGIFTLFGYKPDEVCIKSWEEYIHPEDKGAVIEGMNETVFSTSQQHWKSEYRFRKSDGNYAYVLDRGFIVRDEDKKPVRLIGAMQDITDRKQKEEQLLASNERFDNLMKATHDLIWDWNIETNFFYRDKQGLKKVYGVEDEKSIERFETWLPRVHPEDHEKMMSILNNEIMKGTDQSTFDVEYRFLRDDGTWSYVYDRGILIRNGEGQPVRLIGAAQDITDRKKLEQQLLQRELEKQKLISQATIETQEVERAEIGRELHDNVNQVLTTTKLYLDLSISNPELKDELIQKSSKNIIYVINEIRQLSRSLMNPSLGDLGLLDSITDLIENINLTRKLSVRLKASNDLEETLADNQKLMVFRIIQEALNNAMKHAKATLVDINLHQEQENIHLVITDNGTGFRQQQVRKGSGLKNIHNRVYLADGELQIESEPGQGCTIRIKFPINNTNHPI